MIGGGGRGRGWRGGVESIMFVCSKPLAPHCNEVDMEILCVAATYTQNKLCN